MGGDPEIAWWTVWTVKPSGPAAEAMLPGPAEFTCPVGIIEQSGQRRCTARGRTFRPEPMLGTGRKVIVRLADCVPVPTSSGYKGGWLCDRTGGDPETARWTVWTVKPSGPAAEAMLPGSEEFTLYYGPEEFKCSVGIIEQSGQRRCIARGSTFGLAPVPRF